MIFCFSMFALRHHCLRGRLVVGGEIGERTGASEVCISAKNCSTAWSDISIGLLAQASLFMPLGPAIIGSIFICVKSIIGGLRSSLRLVSITKARQLQHIPRPILTLLARFCNNCLRQVIHNRLMHLIVLDPRDRSASVENNAVSSSPT